MLEKLDANYLGTLKHAYDYASDVPKQLSDICSDNNEIRNAAYYELFGNIWHQGTVYEATVYVFPFLIELFFDPSTPDKDSLVTLIAAIAAGRGFYEVHQHSIDEKTIKKMIHELHETDLPTQLKKEEAINSQIRKEGSRIIPLLVPYLGNENDGVREAVAEALPYYPEHFALSLPALEKALAVEQEESSQEIMESSIETIREQQCSPAG